MNLVTTGKNHVDNYNNYDIHVRTPEQYVSGELYMHVDSKTYNIMGKPHYLTWGIVSMGERYSSRVVCSIWVTL